MANLYQTTVSHPIRLLSKEAKKSITAVFLAH